MKTVLITNKRYSYTDAIDISYYFCPHCESDIIERGFNYCPNCGLKIIWKLSE